MYNRSDTVEILGIPEQTMLNRLMSPVVLNDGSHREGCQSPGNQGDAVAIPVHSGNVRVATGTLPWYTVHDEDP